MCSHPHTVCTGSVGQGYHNFTAQFDSEGRTQRLCAVAALRLRRGGGKVTFSTCSKEQSLFWPDHIPYWILYLVSVLTRAIKIMHTSLWQAEGQVYDSSPSLKHPTRLKLKRISDFMCSFCSWESFERNKSINLSTTHYFFCIFLPRIPTIRAATNNYFRCWVFSQLIVGWCMKWQKISTSVFQSWRWHPQCLTLSTTQRYSVNKPDNIYI